MIFYVYLQEYVRDVGSRLLKIRDLCWLLLTFATKVAKSTYSTPPAWPFSSRSCKSCVLSQDMESKINSFTTSCYRIMLNIMRKDHASNTIIHAITNIKHLVHCVRKRQVGFLCHILRFPEEEPVIKYAFYYHITARGHLDVHKPLTLPTFNVC